MPPPRHRRFRLLADLPLKVLSGEIIYRLAMVQVLESYLWRFEAQWSGGYLVCAYRDSEHEMGKCVYTEGIELEGATVMHAIFERLVAEGRAEVVAAA